MSFRETTSILNKKRQDSIQLLYSLQLENSKFSMEISVENDSLLRE